MLNNTITFDRFIRGLLVVAGLVLVFYAIHCLSSVLIPFFVAGILAYMLYPIVIFFQYKLRLRSRVLCIFLTLILLAALVSGLLYLCVPPMIDECLHLKDVALKYLEKGVNNPTIPPFLQHFFTEHSNKFELDKLLKEKDLWDAIKNIVPKLGLLIWSTANVVISAFASLIALLYLFFLLHDYEKLSAGWIKFVPVKRRKIAAQLAHDIAHGMSGYFRGQALVALSNCIMFSLGFLIIGFPMPIALGCFIGIISFIPYVQLVGFVPATILALLKAADTGQNFWWLIGGVILVYIVVQIFQDAYFTPKIMGKIMGLSPAMILLSLSIWGYMLGIIGLIIALPVTTLITSYYKRYIIKDS